MQKITRKRIIFLLLLLSILLWSFFELKAIYWQKLLTDHFWNISTIILFTSFLLLIGSALLIIYCRLIHQLIFKLLSALPSFSRVLIFIIIGIFPSLLLQFSNWGTLITSEFLRTLLFLSCVYLMTIAIQPLKKNNHLQISRFFPALIFITTIILLSGRLQQITNYPFSLSWSEGNRFWDYSLFLRAGQYQVAEGSQIAAFLDIGRQSLWGIAFLNPNLTIAGMRTWNLLLYFIPPFALGLIIFRSKSIKLDALLFFSLWTYNFLTEGPIYAPLLLSLLLVILAKNIKIYPISLFLVALAGFYVNLTRFTWIIAPSAWAFLLFYFLNESNNSKRRLQKSILAALAGILGGVLLPNLFSIQPSSILQIESTTKDIFTTITNIFTTQDLYWYRLFPSNTFPLGILVALVLLVSPVIFLLLKFIYEQKLHHTRLEKYILVFSFIGFLTIGAVVSVKAGGGSNLHNMDMLLLTILVYVYIYWKKGGEEWLLNKIQVNNIVSIALLGLFLYSGISHIWSVSPLPLPQNEQIQSILVQIQSEIDTRGEEQKILFIDQRQLVTFNTIKNVKMIGEYEKKLLMNEALSANDLYFSDFYRDLASHEFGLIINEPIGIKYIGSDVRYGEENDTYVKWVSEPLLCYYEPLITYREVGVELLIPRTSPIPDNLNCP